MVSSDTTLVILFLNLGPLSSGSIEVGSLRIGSLNNVGEGSGLTFTGFGVGLATGSGVIIG